MTRGEASEIVAANYGTKSQHHAQYGWQSKSISGSTNTQEPYLFAGITSMNLLIFTPDRVQYSSARSNLCHPLTLPLGILKVYVSMQRAIELEERAVLASRGSLRERKRSEISYQR